MRKFTMAALAVLMIPAAASPQGAPRQPSTRPRVRVETGPGSVYTYTDANRGRIGVVVDTRANATNDKVGARIEGVTPGGPAEDAGIKVGDVITKFNGTALAGVSAENDEDSGPGMKLIELARKLEPGDSVQIEYRRGTENRKATIVAEDLGGFSGVFAIPPMRKMMEGGMFPGMDGPEGAMTFAFRSPWGGIEMVKLNPDLGDYFGAREGVLVVRAPEDSTLALKGGDVIVSIGGRKPSSPEQAMRIIRSYDAGESITLDVLRKQKHVNVTWKVPNENDHYYYDVRPRMREEPSWYRVRPRTIRVRNVMRNSRLI